MHTPFTLYVNFLCVKIMFIVFCTVTILCPLHTLYILYVYDLFLTLLLFLEIMVPWHVYM